MLLRNGLYLCSMIQQTQVQPQLDEIVAFFKELQDDICSQLEEADGKARFEQDLWQRAEGGGGRTRVIAGGDVIEKGGVNFSHVHGPMPSKISQKLGIEGEVNFHATGVSIVIHPKSPRVPITHMNVRYFETSDGTHWFGGGIDLTPIYVVEEDARFFHQQMKNTCDRFDLSYYPAYKKWCDEYFYLKHRAEMRGIGGIFFDHLKAKTPEEKKHNHEFVKAVGQTFAPTYVELVRRNKDLPFGEKEMAFQAHRRARYVEFNLVWDRGTKFGLDTGGRTESILMSMPPMAKWAYDYKPEPGSEEAKTTDFLQPFDWLG